jgi:heme/copper-type cytochrome/quinol oxidase subunit 2
MNRRMLQLVNLGALAPICLAFSLSACSLDDHDSENQSSAGATASVTSTSAVSELRPILVEATGRNLYWRFRYAGPDGAWSTADDRFVDQDLHLPAGADVVVLVKSDDYLYTFLAPELGLRRVAVPELTRRLEFHTGAPGVFELAVDPMCGAKLLHEGPMGRLIVQSPAEFRSWQEQTAKVQ